MSTSNRNSRSRVPEIDIRHLSSDPLRCTVSRVTKETDITLTLGHGYDKSCVIDSGIPFFDHMLHSCALHGNFRLELALQGDLAVDYHHSVEDCGLVFGEALARLLTTRPAWQRFGEATIPMDDALCAAVVDLCGRPYLAYRATFPQRTVGRFDCCLAQEFFRALVSRALINLHILLHYADNSHHALEAMFKAWGRALSIAFTPRDTQTSAPSTKGTLSI